MPRSMIVRPTAGTSARINARDIRYRIATGKLPYSEKWRSVWGADLDIDRIADTIAAARLGIMHPLADIGREQFIFDPHLGKLAQKRFGRTKIAPWALQPRTEGLSRQEKSQAKELREMVAGKLGRIRNFRDMIYQLAGGHYDGRAALEIDWQWTGGPAPYTPAMVDWIHPRRLGFGPARELRLVETWGSGGWFEATGIAFDEIPGKFLTYLPKRFLDYPELEGLSLRSVYYSFFKRYGTRKRNILTELFVLPWRNLEGDPEHVQREDMIDAVEIAENMGDETVTGFAPGIKLNMLWPGSENQGQIMTSTIEDVDSQMSRLWMLTDDTSKASGESGGGAGGDQAAYLQAQHDLVYQLDGVDVSECIQQHLVEPIVELNAGPEALHLAPLFELECAPKKDRVTTQKVYSQALLDHVPIPLADYYRDMQIRQPDDDEAVLVMVQGEGGGVGEIKILVPEGAKPPAGMPPPPAPALPSSTATSSRTTSSSGPEKGTEEQSDEDVEPPAQMSFAMVEFAHPDLGHGSPEHIVDRGVREGSRHTSGWADTITASVARLDSETAIHRALAKAEQELPLDALSGTVERGMVRGIMLGALDAAWEAESDEIAAIPAFERGPVLFAGAPSPGFAATPFQEAIKFFLGKAVLARREFDRLRAAAKQKAFTVAGLARKDMLEVAHDELGKVITAGADLRTFDRALGARFDSAGWTRLKPSHVELVMRNNVMGSYHEGRDKQMRQPAVLAARPYWQILGVDDARTRKTHRDAHRKVLRADDAFWSRCPLPWGHNERCRKVSRSQRDLDRLGLTVTSGATLHGLPDPGWS